MVRADDSVDLGPSHLRRAPFVAELPPYPQHHPLQLPCLFQHVELVVGGDGDLDAGVLEESDCERVGPGRRLRLPPADTWRQPVLDLRNAEGAADPVTVAEECAIDRDRMELPATAQRLR